MDDVKILELPPFISVRQVRQYFSMGRRKTYRLLAQKKIRGKIDGRAYVISSASILRHLSRYT